MSKVTKAQVQQVHEKYLTSLKNFRELKLAGNTDSRTLADAALNNKVRENDYIAVRDAWLNNLSLEEYFNEIDSAEN